MNKLLSKFKKGFISLPKKIAVITDKVVESIYGDRVIKYLKQIGKEPTFFSFPAGEEYKNRNTKEHLEDSLFEAGFSRDCVILSLGGGVVTDIAGFLASTFCRGVPLVHIPTTLTAMVDAAIGGKTGVNTKYGKNLIGSFYLPEFVLIEPLFLQTLSSKELKNGIIEMLKLGLVADDEFFNFMLSHILEIYDLHEETMHYAINRAIAIKQAIVERDPKEAGERRILNFGHTFGHALEKITKYNLSHGEAVCIGILGESYLSNKLGDLSDSDFAKVKKAIEKCNFRLNFPFSITTEELFNAMAYDKKGLQGIPRVVLLESIGHAKKCSGEYCQNVGEKTFKQAIDWLLHVMCNS